MQPRHLALLTATAGTAGVALLLVACLPSDAQRRDLQEGFAKYTGRQFVESETIADEYIRKNPTVDNLDEAFYLRGLARFSRNNKAGAAEDLQAAIAKSKRADLKEKAYRTLGDIDYDDGKWEQALENYRKSIAAATAPPAWGQENNKAPASKPDAYVNYRAGCCLQNLGQWEQARSYFQVVASVNTDPQLTSRAVTRMNARNFALQFGAFQDGPKAAELIKQLKAANIVATAATEMREGQVLYLVRSGSYNTWQEAEAARARLLAKFPAVVIVP